MKKLLIILAGLGLAAIVFLNLKGCDSVGGGQKPLASLKSPYKGS